MLQKIRLEILYLQRSNHAVFSHRGQKSQELRKEIPVRAINCSQFSDYTNDSIMQNATEAAINIFTPAYRERERERESASGWSVQHSC